MDGAKPKNATMSDVARLAGVSMKTVSRVFNNEKYVSEDKKKKILEVAAALNYRPSLQARGLAGSRSFMVGLFVDDPSGDYVSKVLRSVLNCCHDAGSHLVVEVLRERGDDAKLRQTLNSIKFDGVVLAAPICDDLVVLNALRETGVPVARIGPGVEAPDMAKVQIDDYQAAFEMTAHLIGMGHRRIGFVKGDPNHGCTIDRERGYARAMQAHGLPVENDLIVPGMFSFASGRKAAEALFDRPDRPTAVFVSNDEMAAGVLAVAREKGIDVPGEVSLAGFDDDVLATIVSPTLTTVKQPIEAMAQAAFDMILGEQKPAAGAPALSVVLRFEIFRCETVRKLS
jgi:LacI family transcriptional regulator